VLVPAIALTPQLVDRFRALPIPDCRPCIRRSRNDAARPGETLRGSEDRIGTRSARLHRPARLKYVVDEEHDASYSSPEGFAIRPVPLRVAGPGERRCPSSGFGHDLVENPEKRGAGAVCENTS